MGSAFSKVSDFKRRRCDQNVLVENLEKELKTTSRSVMDDLNLLKARINSIKDSTTIAKNVVSTMEKSFTGNGIIAQPDLCPDGATELSLDRTNPLLNDVVLNTIIDMLDLKSVKNARLVCKAWNNVTIPIMGKTSKVVCLVTTLGEFDTICNTPIGLVQEAWLRNIELHQPICQVLIADYGYRLKRLKITSGPLDLRYLHSILTTWCLNLESLDYNEIEKPKTDVDGISDNFHLPRPLNLISATLAGISSYSDRNRSQDGFSVKPLSAILTSSPKLRHLTLRVVSADFEAILKKTKQIPHIPYKLISLRIETFDSRIYPNAIKDNCFSHHSLLKVGFATELRKLTLLNTIGLEFLPELLAKLSGTLEAVYLYRYKKEKERGPEVDQRSIQSLKFPKLDKMKTFKNFSFSTFPITSIDFVKSMENLETLLLTEYDASGQLQIDELFTDCASLEGNPHKSLKSLTLLGRISTIKTLQSIRNVFPNLMHLQIELGDYSGSRYSINEQNDWIQEAVRQISMIPSLRNLHLKFKETVKPKKDAFSYLRNMSDLRNLTLERGWDHETLFPFPARVENIFCKIRRLESVTLVGWTMCLTAAKALMDALENSRIRLEIVPIHTTLPFIHLPHILFF